MTPDKAIKKIIKRAIRAINREPGCPDPDCLTCKQQAEENKEFTKCANILGVAVRPTISEWPFKINYNYLTVGDLNIYDFNKLVEMWHWDISHISDSFIIVEHPAYQQIINAGKAVLPFIFDRMKEEPDHWFVALEAITGVNPVPSEFSGNLVKQTEIWLKWAVENGYKLKKDNLDG